MIFIFILMRSIRLKLSSMISGAGSLIIEQDEVRMNFMKTLCILLFVGLCMFACNAGKRSANDDSEKLRTVVQNGHRSSVCGIYFSKGDRMFLSMSQGLVKLWDVKTKRLISTWDKMPDYVNLLGFGTEDHVIGMREDFQYTLNCLDGAVIQKKPVRAIEIDQPTSENIWKTVTDEDGFETNVWNSRTGRYQVAAPKHPGGMWVRHTGFGLTLHDLQAKTSTILNEEERWIWDMAISGDGRFLACIEERLAGLREIRLYDLFLGALVHKFAGIPKEIKVPTNDSENEKYEHCMINSDGSRIMVCATNGSFYLWRTSNWELIHYSLAGLRLCIDYPAMNISGTLIATRVADRRGRVSVVDVESKDIIKTFPLASFGDDHGFAFSPDGRYLACVSNNRIKEIFSAYAEPPKSVPRRLEIVVWDYKTQKQLIIIKDNQRYIRPFAFNEDSKYLLCGFNVYKIEDGTLVKSIPDLEEKDLKGLVDDFGLFWEHHSQFAMNPGSSHYVILDQNTGNMKIVDPKNHQKKCEVFSFYKSMVMVTPDGHFSGTGDYQDKVHFLKGKTVYPFERFFEKFYCENILKGSEEKKVRRK